MWANSYRCHVRDSQGHGSGTARRFDYGPTINPRCPGSMASLDLDGTAPMVRPRLFGRIKELDGENNLLMDSETDHPSFAINRRLNTKSYHPTNHHSSRNLRSCKRQRSSSSGSCAAFCVKSDQLIFSSLITG